MQVSLEKLEEWRRFISAINDYQLSEIEWTRNGEVLPVSKEQIDEFRFVGLCNTGFPDFAGLTESST